MVGMPGQKERGERFLRSLVDTTKGGGVQRLIIVADEWEPLYYGDTWMDVRLDSINPNFAWGILHFLGRQGSARAHNIGLAHASKEGSRYLGILEDGIILTPGWLEFLTDALEEDPRRGWVGALQRPNTRSRFMCCCSVMTREFYEAMVKDTHLGMQFFDEKNFRTGPFDDSYAVWRARELGFRPSGVSACVVEHPVGETTMKGLFDSVAHHRNFQEKRAAFERLTGLPDFDWDSMPVVE